jgi:AdoMet-dependent rRNA methyltransferase SPB1
METESPYAVFVDCTEIEITPKDREQYLTKFKYPAELEDWCKDLILLGKREISNMVKWRFKVRDAKKKENRAKFDKIEYGAHDEEDKDEEDPEDELYQIEKKERRAQEKLKEKKMLHFAKQSEATGVGIAGTELEMELAGFDFEEHGDLMRKGDVYTDFAAEDAAEMERLRGLGGRHHEYKKKVLKPNSEEEVMDNLEYLYEMKLKRQQIAEARVREKQLEKELRKKRFLGEENQDEDAQRAEEGLKMERLESKDQFLRKRALDETSNRVSMTDLKKSKWFDRDIFDIMEPVKKTSRSGLRR